MKVPLMILFVLISTIAISQKTYYRPQNTLKLTVEIKEPYKPVNWAEIGANFSNSISAEMQRREGLKKYYDDIFFQTRNAIISNTLLTNDNLIDSKLISLQSVINESLNRLNRSLKSGSIKPVNYESQLNKTYYDYLGANQIFVNLSIYKTNKIRTLNNDVKINEFNNIFNELIALISGFENNNGITFNVANPKSPNTYYDINTMYEKLTSLCELKLKGSNYISENTQQNQQSNSNNDVNGRKIGNLEVFGYDFQNKMNWEEAKAACASLGYGWRLPTKEELYILYKNKDNMVGFSNNDYWSSMDDDKGNAWKLDFKDGRLYLNGKANTLYVRAIRFF